MSNTDLKDLLDKFNNPELLKEAEAITEEEITTFTAGLKPIGKPEHEKELGKALPAELVLYVLADKKDKVISTLVQQGWDFMKTEEYKSLGKVKGRERIKEMLAAINVIRKLIRELKAVVEESVAKHLGSEYEVVVLRKDGVFAGVINPQPICPACNERHAPFGGILDVIFGSRFAGINVTVTEVRML